MKCKKCQTEFHTCSSCELDSVEEFSYYNIGVCLSCFDTVNGRKRFEDMRFEMSAEEDRVSLSIELDLDIR